MCDYFDDFDGDDFIDMDSLEDSPEAEMDEPCDAEPEEGHDDSESQDDDFTAKDAFFIGGAMGFAYEECLNERKRRKRKRFNDDSD